LKAHREAAEWTRAELAARLQYSESLIAAIEGQDRVPQKEFAVKSDEDVFKLFNNTVFPGLFQTEDYARSILEKVGWRKSSFSGTNGAECVAAASHDGAVLVRDTKDTKQRGRSRVHRYTAEEWRAFVAAIRTAR
jgi:hypothetical protein